MLADTLDKNPDIEVPQLYISAHYYEKETFKAFVAGMPRPLKKSLFLPNSVSPDLHVEFSTRYLRLLACVPQSVA